MQDALLYFLFENNVAQGAHSAAAVLLGHKGGVDAGFFGNLVQPRPLFRWKGAQYSGDCFQNPSGSSFVSFAVFGRMSEEFRFQRNALLPDYLADRVFQCFKFGREAGLRRNHNLDHVL